MRGPCGPCSGDVGPHSPVPTGKYNVSLQESLPLDFGLRDRGPMDKSIHKQEEPVSARGCCLLTSGAATISACCPRPLLWEKCILSTVWDRGGGGQVMARHQYACGPPLPETSASPAPRAGPTVPTAALDPVRGCFQVWESWKEGPPVFTFPFVCCPEAVAARERGELPGRSGQGTKHGLAFVKRGGGAVGEVAWCLLWVGAVLGLLIWSRSPVPFIHGTGGHSGSGHTQVWLREGAEKP